MLHICTDSRDCSCSVFACHQQRLWIRASEYLPKPTRKEGREAIPTAAKQDNVRCIAALHWVWWRAAQHIAPSKCALASAPLILVPVGDAPSDATPPTLRSRSEAVGSCTGRPTQKQNASNERISPFGVQGPFGPLSSHRSPAHLPSTYQSVASMTMKGCW